MQVPADESHLAGSPELTLEINGERPLTELTEVINAACDEVEDSPGHSVVSLWLGETPLGDRSWPDKVTIQQVSRWERAVRRLERLTAVTLAVAEGTCGGPALDLLLAADYRIVSAGTRVLLAVNDGRLWPGMAVHRLVNQVGVTRGRQVLLWGSELTAQRARDMGLVDEIAADAADAVRVAVLFLGHCAGRDLAVLRQLVLEAPITGFDEALGVHLAACDRELRHRRGHVPFDDRSGPGREVAGR